MAAALGFPAHAGMDLISVRTPSLTAWFPRPRGDGPSICGRGSGTSAVSPPTRGWTPIHRVRRQPDRGFPAHAGMDPSPTCRRGAPSRFPRPRGDGPRYHHAAASERRVSPPTRGWTLTPACSAEGSPGFPAHAGMDRSPPMSCVVRPWFPRPRGDGPGQAAFAIGELEVSPPTRGWTVARMAADHRRAGFPAHAGMDHHSVCPCRPTARFPRPRGDGPCSCMPSRNGVAVSPPTRGWTHRAIAGFRP